MERAHDFGKFCVIVLEKDDLSESVSVSQVDEEYAAVIADGVDPASERYGLSVMFFPKFAASVGS
jgi:hypothetical protein